MKKETKLWLIIFLLIFLWAVGIAGFMVLAVNGMSMTASVKLTPENCVSTCQQECLPEPARLKYEKEDFEEEENKGVITEVTLRNGLKYLENGDSYREKYAFNSCREKIKDNAKSKFNITLE